MGLKGIFQIILFIFIGVPVVLLMLDIYNWLLINYYWIKPAITIVFAFYTIWKIRLYILNKKTYKKLKSYGREEDIYPEF